MKVTKGFIDKTLVFVFCLIFTLMIYNFIKYPEKYVTTWKYQLYNDIKEGNPQAIEYYQSKYMQADIQLFEL